MWLICCKQPPQTKLGKSLYFMTVVCKNGPHWIILQLASRDQVIFRVHFFLICKDWVFQVVCVKKKKFFGCGMERMWMENGSRWKIAGYGKVNMQRIAWYCIWSICILKKYHLFLGIIKLKQKRSSYLECLRNVDDWKEWGNAKQCIHHTTPQNLVVNGTSRGWYGWDPRWRHRGR